jgi:NADH-quinone oxidoreductase subunit C
MLPDNLQETPVAAALETTLPGAVRDGRFAHGELTLIIEPGSIVAVCALLKLEHGFVRLSDLTAVDRLPDEPRFEVVYHLHSFKTNQRLRLKCLLPVSAPEIDSVTCVWRSADWYEREVFDLFGIPFRGHPNLRRIMMPVDWEGHPLRKDYPVHGGRYSYKDE